MYNYHHTISQLYRCNGRDLVHSSREHPHTLSSLRH